jgi:hypothetical protein
MQLRLMSTGESMTFTQTIRDIPDPRATSKFAQLIGGYASRHRPSAHWSYEGFTAITSRGRPIVGVVLTLVAEGGPEAGPDPPDPLAIPDRSAGRGHENP